MFLGSCILGFEACGLGRLDLGRSKTCGSDLHSTSPKTQPRSFQRTGVLGIRGFGLRAALGISMIL